MTGYMGLCGTDRLLALTRDRLAGRFSAAFLEGAAEQYRRMQEACAGLRQRLCGEIQVWEAGQDGFLQTLWQMSRGWNTGFTVQLRDVPLRQETVEICEVLEVNPYELDTAGCLLIGAEQGYRLCRRLQQEGIPAAVIGALTDSHDCLLVHGDTKSFLNRPEEEACARYLRESGPAEQSVDDYALAVPAPAGM